MIKENCDPLLGCGQPNILFRPFEIIGGNPPPPPFDPSYQAVINYATSQAYTLPSAANQARQNKLVVDLKAAGIWAGLDVFYNFFTDGDANFAKINWLQPGVSQATTFVGVSFTPLSGFASNGVAGSNLNTNHILQNGTNYKALDASVFLDYQKAITVSGILYGSFIGTSPNSYVQYQLTPLNSVTINGNSPAQAPPEFLSGLSHLLVDSASVRLYLNSSLYNVPVVSVNKGTPGAIPLVIFARGADLALPMPATARCLGAGASLAGKEAALYNVWQSYKTNATQPLEVKLLLVGTDGSVNGFAYQQFGDLTPDYFEGIPVDKFAKRLDDVIELKLVNGFKLPYVDIVRMFIGDEALDLYWNGVDQYEALAPLSVSSFIVVGNVVPITLIALR